MVSTDALITAVERSGVGSDAIGDLVHDVAAKTASDTNNSGLDAQITYLVAMLGEASACTELAQLGVVLSRATAAAS